jgi:hypothetical protein
MFYSDYYTSSDDESITQNEIIKEIKNEIIKETKNEIIKDTKKESITKKSIKKNYKIIKTLFSLF